MNTLVKRTVGIMLVTTCMLGTTAFADNTVPPNEMKYHKNVLLWKLHQQKIS